MRRDGYIPALHFGWLTPVYDPIIRWTMREAIFKPRLVQQANIEPGHRVLDLGCGTATLTLLLKQAQPHAQVIGLDGDPQVLDVARAKAAQANLRIELDQGMAFTLPYPDKSFDHVVCSLVLHHLTHENKVRTLKEVFRVLKPGGELHVADFGKPHNSVMTLISFIVRHLEETTDHIKGLLPAMLRDAGFERIEETACYATIMGTLSLFRGRKPC